MARLNVLLTGYEITDEIIKRTSSTALALGHDTIRGTADLEIWTGAGGTGTQLALTTDYTVSDEDTDLSTEAGVSIYTKLAIVNGTYHNVDLYVTYKTIGDYASAETVRAFDAEYTEVTGNYTVLETDRYLRITTASAITITIPDTMPDNWPLTFSRTVASANAVTVATSGAETVEGGASFVVIGAKAAAEYDPSEVTLRKVAGEWRFVGGVVSGSNANGFYKKYSDGTLVQNGPTKTITSGINAECAFIFPIEFYYDYSGGLSVVYSMTSNAGTYSKTYLDNGTPTIYGFSIIMENATNLARFTYIAEGRWRA